jgi:hypothetical protein
VGAADAVKDNVHALTREAVNFLHEVELSVVNRSGATTENPSFASPSGAAITSSCRPHRAWMTARRGPAAGPAVDALAGWPAPSSFPKGPSTIRSSWRPREVRAR